MSLSLMLATWTEAAEGHATLHYGFGDFDWLCELNGRERRGEVRIVHSWWVKDVTRTR